MVNQNLVQQLDDAYPKGVWGALAYFVGRESPPKMPPQGGGWVKAAQIYFPRPYKARETLVIIIPLICFDFKHKA